MRTTRSLPICIWGSGQLQSPLDIELVESATEHNGVEGIMDNDRKGEIDSRSVLQSHSISLIDQCKSQLASQAPYPWSSESYGVDHYVKAVEIINRDAPSISGPGTRTTMICILLSV